MKEKKHLIEVHFSYRTYEEKPISVTCIDPEDLSEEEIIEALRASGMEFGEDEELQVDSWGAL